MAVKSVNASARRESITEDTNMSISIVITGVMATSNPKSLN